MALAGWAQKRFQGQKKENPQKVRYLMFKKNPRDFQKAVV